MEQDHCSHLGFPINTILASFYYEVILLLQSKFGLKATKDLGRDFENWSSNGGCGAHVGFSIGSFSYFVSTRCPNAHHQVSI